MARGKCSRNTARGAHLHFVQGPVSPGGPGVPRAAPPATARSLIRRPQSGRPTSGGAGQKRRCAHTSGSGGGRTGPSALPADRDVGAARVGVAGEGTVGVELDGVDAAEVPAAPGLLGQDDLPAQFHEGRRIGRREAALGLD